MPWASPVLREGLAPLWRPCPLQRHPPRVQELRERGLAEQRGSHRAVSGSAAPASSSHPVRAVSRLPPPLPAVLGPSILRALLAPECTGHTGARLPQLCAKACDDTHLTLEGAVPLQNVLCVSCMSEKDGPERSAGFSLFPKPRAHFLKPPFDTISPLGPGVPHGCCDGPTWVLSPAPPELWAAFRLAASSSLLTCFCTSMTFLCTHNGAQFLPLALGTLVGRFLAFGPLLSSFYLNPYQGRRDSPGWMGLPRGDGVSQWRWVSQRRWGVPGELCVPHGSSDPQNPSCEVGKFPMSSTSTASANGQILGGLDLPRHSHHQGRASRGVCPSALAGAIARGWKPVPRGCGLPPHTLLWHPNPPGPGSRFPPLTPSWHWPSGDKILG